LCGSVYSWNVEILLDDALFVVEEWPVGTHAEAQVIELDEGVGGDRNQPGKAHGALLREPYELVQLLAVLRAVEPAPKHQDHRIVALQQ